MARYPARAPSSNSTSTSTSLSARKRSVRTDPNSASLRIRFRLQKSATKAGSRFMWADIAAHSSARESTTIRSDGGRPTSARQRHSVLLGEVILDLRPFPVGEHARVDDHLGDVALPVLFVARPGAADVHVWERVVPMDLGAIQ